MLRNLASLVMLLIVLWTISIATFAMVIENRCLELGYPEYRITANFRGYCVNLEGAVVGRVVEIHGGE